MTPAEARRLFAYHRWANGRILDAAAALGAGEFDRDLRSSFPSVRATLVHLLSAEWIWLERWRGTSPTGWAEADALTTFAALRERWAAIEARQAAFVDGLDAPALARRCAYRNLRGEALEFPLGDLLTHVANHATHHRGQVTTMLRQLGRTPPATDFSAFLREAAPA